MMTAADVLDGLSRGRPVGGRHVVVSAHPDDESISFGGALCCLDDVLIVQLTHGVPDPAQAAIDVRLAERRAAFAAAGWTWPVVDCLRAGRRAHDGLLSLLALVHELARRADVIWTHPYEGGHLDHDTAAWLAQTACRPDQLRMEFASYHSHRFGAFWPDPKVSMITAPIAGHHLTRKRAALAAYTSQRHILRKFPHHDLEPYRVAPVYDFTRLPPPLGCRWDQKGYQPTTAEWRAAVATAAAARAVRLTPDLMRDAP